MRLIDRSSPVTRNPRANFLDSWIGMNERLQSQVAPGRRCPGRLTSAATVHSPNSRQEFAVFAPHKPGSRGRQSAPSSTEGYQRRLTSAATVHGSKARDFFWGDPLSRGEDRGERQGAHVLLPGSDCLRNSLNGCAARRESVLLTQRGEILPILPRLFPGVLSVASRSEVRRRSETVACAVAPWAALSATEGATI